MPRDTIARILDIEKEAVAITADAEREAKQLLAEARRDSEKLLAGANSTEQVAQIIAEGKAQAQVVRERILAQAETEIQQMEETAVDHLKPAVEFVLNRVVGA